MYLLLRNRKFHCVEPKDFKFFESKLERAEILIELFKASIQDLSKYKMFMVLLNGKKLILPPVEEIMIDQENLSMSFISETFTTMEHFIVERIGVLNSDNYCVFMTEFSTPVFIESGKQLFFKAICNFHIP